MSVGSGKDDRVERVFNMLKNAPAAPQANGATSVDRSVNVRTGSHSNVTIIQGKKIVERMEVVVRPGNDHITDAQAGRIQELVGIIAGRGRRSFGSVYGELFRHLGGGHRLVPSYRLIPKEMFAKAEAFLTDWQDNLGKSQRRR